MVKITYFVHSSSVDSEQKISSGWHDIGLSESGIQQAAALREQVQSDFYAVFCSDLKRAQETAGIVFPGLNIIPDKRLRECNYGEYNGKPSNIVEPMFEKNIFSKFSQGESCEDVKERIDDFLGFLKSNYDGKRVAIVSHKAPQLALDVLLKGKTWEQAFTEDWRKKKAWQPGWEYFIS
jgi:broad specificity phosphatase PhoE